MTQGTKGRGRALAVGAWVAGCFVLGACSRTPEPTREIIAGLRADVQKTVTDPARATRALAALDSMSALVPVYLDFEARTANDLRVFLRNYDATRADFDRASAGWETDRAKLRGRVLAAHEAFKQALTDEEWKKLQDEEREILSQYPIVRVQGSAAAAEVTR